eukprot:7230662-Pyramimonas_sp.AAC.1
MVSIFWAAAAGFAELLLAGASPHLAEGRVVAVMMAPPCATFSRAQQVPCARRLARARPAQPVPPRCI